ncbi:MAG: GNAT family N-acetyltransferase [Paracoccaceae bacterium]|nr:GNAT family N-acetyltransferase [Paracoccaceae bacterium]
MTVVFQIPELETDRLRLRAPHLDDWPVMCEFFASDRAKFVGGPMTAEQTWRGLATETGHWALRGFGRWALEEKATGKFIGNCGLWEPDGFPEMELGWDLMAGATGKGYATEAGAAARALAYNALGRTTVISMIAPGNDGSKAVATRLGAAFEKMFSHVTFGDVEIWRHPTPEALK